MGRCIPGSRDFFHQCGADAKLLPYLELVLCLSTANYLWHSWKNWLWPIIRELPVWNWCRHKGRGCNALSTSAESHLLPVFDVLSDFGVCWKYAEIKGELGKADYICSMQQMKFFFFLLLKTEYRNCIKEFSRSGTEWKDFKRAPLFCIHCWQAASIVQL